MRIHHESVQRFGDAARGYPDRSEEFSSTTSTSQASSSRTSAGKLRILLLSHSRNDPNGGASRIYHLLDFGLSSRGHDVTTCHYEDYGFPRNRILRRLIDRLYAPRLISAKASVIGRYGYDVIMASNGMAYPLFRALSPKADRPLLVNHFHGLNLFDHQANLTEHLAGRIQLSLSYRAITGRLPILWDFRGSRLADLTIVQNGRDQDFLERCPRYASRAITIAPGLHPQLLEASDRMSPPEARPNASLLWFGSWSARKGCALIPFTFQRVLERLPQATLTIGGTNLPGEQILGFFSSHCASRIRVLPRLSVAEQVEEFERHSIYLCPSLSEGFGLALLEAMALGLASVTTHTGMGGDYIIHGQHGLLIPPASSLHLANAIVDLVRNDELRYAIARSGQRLARQFTVGRMASEYEQAFHVHRSILGHRSANA